MKFSKRIFAVIGFLSLVTGFLGCAAVTEGVKGVLGSSTRALEVGRKNALKETFAYNLDVCYDKLKMGLLKRGCYIYALDPQQKMIAVYVSRTDTTPVGVFFTKVDDNNTQVEVSSPSVWAKEFMLKRVSSILTGKSDPDAQQQREVEMQIIEKQENVPLESNTSARDRAERS
ncbi:MAG: hypothetical protein Q8O22_00645 [Candidatus Omnitrophota bacterium]|nr:hypothetical protein [Candidatus Omnitrophota bacterium]